MGLMKKLTSAIVASSLVLSLVGSAFAAYTPAAGETAGNRMMALKVLTGRPGADPLALKEEITRAELVTVIVRAFGQEENAKLLAGAAAYPDTAKHWASGNIAMAKALIEKNGESMGMPDGSFAPDAKLTPAQAVAFLMKFLGVKPEANKTWPANYLDAAVTAGLITAADKAVIAPIQNDNATRGLVFYVFDNAFYSYDLGAGKTFYTKYVDMAAPVVTLNAVEKTTIDTKVTISGKAEGAKEVYVGTTAVTVAADGTFSTEFALPEIKEYTITVTARDVAGNAAEKAVSIARTVGTVATVEAAAITVAAGATVDVNAVAKDAKGNTVATTFTGESTVGTFADGKFTAGKTAGTGTLTLKAGEKTATVNVTVTAGALAKVEADKASAAPGEIVTLVAKDENGNVITGATFSQTSTDAMLDGTTGKFMASKAGNYTVTAKVGTVEKTATIGVYAAFSTAAKIVVEAPQTIVGNGTSKVVVTAKVVDANGNLITNYNGGVALTAIGNLTATETADKNGVATYEIKAGNALTGQVLTLEAVSSANNAVKGTTTIQVIQQVATSVKVDAPTFLAVNNNDGTISSATPVKVYVLDQSGEPMLSGAFAVTLDLTGSAATFASDRSTSNTTTVVYNGAVDAANGKSVDLYAKSLTNVGDVTINGTVTGLTAGTDKITAAYAQAPSQLGLTVTTTRSTYVADVDANAQRVTFKVELRDANGVPANRSTNTTVTLDLGISDLSKVKIFALDAGNSFARIDSDLVEAGFQALSNNPTVTINAGDSSAEISFESETFIGDLNVTAKVTNLTSATAKATFVTGDVYSVGFSRSTVKVAQGTESVDLSAQIYDAAGNKVKKAGQKVYFTANGTNTWVNGGEKATVETDANGVATVKVTTIGYYSLATFNNGVYQSGGYLVNIDLGANATNLQAKAAGADVTYVSVDNAVASSLNIRTQKNGVDVFYVTGVDSVDVYAIVKDAKGQNLPNETVKAVFPKGTLVVDANGNRVAANANGATTNSAETTITMVWDGTLFNNAGAYKLTGVYFAKAPTATFTVKDTSGVADLVATGTLAVAPNAASKIVLTSADSNNKVAYTKATVSGPYTIQLTDAFGNPVYADATTGDVNITWNYPGTIDAAAGEYFEVKASATGARLDGTNGKLVIKQGSNSVTFYVFGNDDAAVTFNAAGTALNAPALGSTAATTFDQ